MNKSALFLAGVLLLGAAPSWADASRDDAAAIAVRAGGGRVLSVDRAQSGGHAVWRVKLLTAQGEVKVIFVDVASGRIV
jgi:uncharacterized membrane protein YkoI